MRLHHHSKMALRIIALIRDAYRTDGTCGGCDQAIHRDEPFGCINAEHMLSWT